MILLPPNWPFRGADDTEIIMSKLTKEEAEEIISYLKSGNIERCLKTSTKSTEKDAEKEERDAFIADQLYSTTGNIKDVPNMDQLPEEIQQLLIQYEDVFREKLVEGRTMECPPIELKVDKDKKKPEECIRPRPVPAHWKKQHDEILDYLEMAKLIEKLDTTEGFLSPSFCILHPSDI